MSEFRSLRGYNIRWQLVHAKDYGVPQNRPRVLIVGIKKTIQQPLSNNEDKAVESGFLPDIVGGYPHLEEVFSDLIDKKFEYGGETTKYPFSPKNHWQEQIRTKPNGAILEKGDQLTEQEYSKHGAQIQAKFQAMIDNDGEMPKKYKTKKFAQRLLPKKWGNKGPTITITSLPDDFVHYSQARTPTVESVQGCKHFLTGINLRAREQQEA